VFFSCVDVLCDVCACVVYIYVACVWVCLGLRELCASVFVGMCGCVLRVFGGCDFVVFVCVWV